MERHTESVQERIVGTITCILLTYKYPRIREFSSFGIPNENGIGKLRTDHLASDRSEVTVAAIKLDSPEERKKEMKGNN